MRSLYLLIRTEFLSLVGSTNRKGKTPFVVAAILLIVFGLLMIGTMAFTGGVTAYELVKKDLTEFSIFVSISLSMVIGRSAACACLYSRYGYISSRHVKDRLTFLHRFHQSSEK